MKSVRIKHSQGRASQKLGWNGGPKARTQNAGERGAVRHAYFCRGPCFSRGPQVQTGRAVMLVSPSLVLRHWQSRTGFTGAFVIQNADYLVLRSFPFLPLIPEDLCPSRYASRWERPLEDTRMDSASSEERQRSPCRKQGWLPLAQLPVGLVLPPAGSTCPIYQAGEKAFTAKLLQRISEITTLPLPSFQTLTSHLPLSPNTPVIFV